MIYENFSYKHNTTDKVDTLHNNVTQSSFGPKMELEHKTLEQIIRNMQEKFDNKMASLERELRNRYDLLETKNKILFDETRALKNQVGDLNLTRSTTRQDNSRTFDANKNFEE